MADWDDNPSNYLKDDDGNFVLKKDGTPRRKSGRPKGSTGRPYNYHSKTKAKIKKRRIIKDKEKLVARTEKKLQSHRQSLKKAKSVVSQLDKPNTSKIITEDELSTAPKSVQEEATENVIFAPNDGPQTEFLAAGETDVLYGGAAGGGKSYAMLVDPLRYAHRAAHRALISGVLCLNSEN